MSSTITPLQGGTLPLHSSARERAAEHVQSSGRFREIVPSTISRSRFVLHALPWLFPVILWIIWHVVSPRLIPQIIENAYYGRSYSILNKMIADNRQKHEAVSPRLLSFYLGVWDHSIRPIAPYVLVLGSAFICAMFNILLAAYSASKEKLAGQGEIAEKTVFRIIALAAACMLVVLSLPLLTGMIYTLDDFAAIALPLRYFYVDALMTGSDFTWCPALFCGFDTQVNGAGMYHPLQMFLYRFLPVDVALNLELLVCYPAIFLGMYFFCRRWRFSRSACMFGAYTLAFNSFMLLRIVQIGVIATVAHLPWALLCCDVIMRGSHRRNIHLSGLMLALFTASQLLLGHAQFIWMTFLVEAVYIFILAVSSRSYFPVANILCCKLLGVLLGAIQLLPTMEALPLSTRAVRDLDYQGFLSFHPLNLLQLLSPYCFRKPVEALGNIWEGSCYTGIIAVALCIWLLTRKADLIRNRVVVILALLLTITGFALALGKYLPVFPLITQLPGFGFFRCPNRYNFVAQFGLAILTTCAFACLLDTHRGTGRSLKSNRIFLLLIGVLIALCLLCIFAFLRDPRHGLSDHISSPGLVFLGPALLVIGAIGVLGALKGYRGLILVLVCLHVMDLGVYGESFILLRGWPKTLGDILANLHAPPANKGDRIYVDERDVQPHNLLIMKGFRLTGGYVGLLPNRELNYEKPADLGVAGVTWKEEYTASSKQFDWLRLDDSLPRVRLFCHSMLSENVNSQIEQIDWRNTALVSQSLSLTGETPGTAKFVKDVSGEMRITADANSRQLLFVSESFHPGWRVEVDGKRQEVIRVFADFMGCVIEPGSHQVKFYWQPSGLVWGKAISSIAAAVVVIWLTVIIAMGVRFRRKKGREEIERKLLEYAQEREISVPPARRAA